MAVKYMYVYILVYSKDAHNGEPNNTSEQKNATNINTRREPFPVRFPVLLVIM